jgi:hypothetical protein
MNVRLFCPDEMTVRSLMLTRRFIDNQLRPNYNTQSIKDGFAYADLRRTTCRRRMHNKYLVSLGCYAGCIWECKAELSDEI